MTSRKLSDLSSTMQAKAEMFLAACETDDWLRRNGITVLVTCTWRSPAEQDQLYAQGRAAPGRIVTRARGGQSWHNAINAAIQPAAEALDIVPLRHGKPVWGNVGDGIDDDSTDDDVDDLEVWQRIGALGKAAGLNWYGDPDADFREFPHFQNPAPTMRRSI